MYELLANLWMGFGVAATPTNVMLCMIGATVGTLIGVLPGIGSLATIAMLLPITFGLPPVGALIMLAGIYYGAQYGGSTTSILVEHSRRIFVGGHDASTATRWRVRAAPDRRSPSPPSARSSQAASRPSWSRRSAPRSPRWRCCSAPPNTSR